MIKLPINILPVLFKVSEKSIFKQQYVDDKKFKSQILCGFRKAHSTQQALFRLLQPWQKELDNSGCVCTIFVDLSKAYDCRPQDLLTAKLEEYRLGKTAWSFLLDDLSRTKTGPVYSQWVKIPQRFCFRSTFI